MSVCHLWHTIIKSPSFVHNHFYRDGSRTGRLLGYSFSPHRAVSLFPDGTLKRYENLPQCIVRICGTCNGIVCVLLNNDSLALWNPATRSSWTILPDFPCLVGSDYIIGFGIDPLSDNDVKIVFFSEDFEGRDFETYTSSNDSWKFFEAKANVVVDDFLYIQHNYSKLNSFYYWIKYTSHCSGCSTLGIIAFDMQMDSFQELEMPQIITSSGKVGELDSYKGDLALFLHNNNSHNLDIWLMKEQGYWTKLKPVILHSLNWCLIGFWKENEIVVMFGNGDLTAYDLDSHSTRNVAIPVDPCWSCSYHYI